MNPISGVQPLIDKGAYKMVAIKKFGDSAGRVAAASVFACACTLFATNDARADFITDQIIQNAIQNVLQNVRDRIQRRGTFPGPGQIMRFSREEEASSKFDEAF